MLLDAGTARVKAFDFLVDIAAELPMQMVCILPECLKERRGCSTQSKPTFDFQ